MVYDLLIHNARIVTPRGTVRGAVLVDNGQVAAVLTGDDSPDAKETVDAGGNFLVPGVVDIHVHFREPGQEYKATYASESAAAAVGGVTTICDMPNNGIQAVVSPERVAAKSAAAFRSALVDFGIYAYLINSSLEAKRALQEAGVIGLKWDMSLAGTEPAPGAWLPTIEEALEGFRHAAALGLTVGIHAEDRASVARGVAALQAAGRTDTAAHLATRPAEVEAIALRQALDLVRATGARLHVHHLSSEPGLQLVRGAKREGLPVTAETIPPFLFLDSSDYERLGTVMKIYPAVKEPADRAALWEGVLDGSIDCIATDHAPHTAEEKLKGVWDASAGAIGVQTSLSLMLTEVSAGRLTLDRCVELMSANPARIHGLHPRKGAIVAGADADLVLIDLDRGATIVNEGMLSPNHLTPFHGRETRGVPYRTWLRGQLTASDGRPTNQAFGKQVRPGTGAITAPRPRPGTV